MCVFCFVFCLSIFVPGPKGLVLPKGGAPRGGALIRGGGADASIGPRALETLGTPLVPRGGSCATLTFLGHSLTFSHGFSGSGRCGGGCI